jgi:hypothetical protein
MSTPVRLIGFAAVLVVVFAVAGLAGRAADVRRGVAAKPAADAHGMGAMTEKAADPIRGLAVSEHGLTLELARTTARPGERFELAFRIADRRGRTVRAFDVEHTKRMHFIVVRRDLTGFQHLHPVQRPDGTWSIPVTLRDPGSYRVFADFSTGGTPKTLAADLTADGSVRSQRLPAPATTADVDGFRVNLAEQADKQLRFSVTRGGRPATVEPYLGARGHLVALREGDLAFLHVHPDAHSLRFMAEFPTAGRYRLFLQFKVDGQVHTAAFTREVSR